MEIHRVDRGSVERALRLTAILASLFASEFAIAQDDVARTETVIVRPGFITGEAYLEMSESNQTAYMMGIVDGVLSAGLYGAPDTRLMPFQECLERMSGPQMKAILAKYLGDNPNQWHYGVNVVFFGALKEACD